MQLLKPFLLLAGIVTVLFAGYLLYVFLFKPVHLQKMSLMTLNGETLTSAQVVNGKHTIFNFWATWCKPCIAEMPLLDSVYQRMDTSRWQVVLISDEPLDKIIRFREKTSYSMPFFKLQTPLSEIGISALPRTIVTDERGNVLFSKTGMLTMDADAFLRRLEEDDQGSSEGKK